MRRTFNRELLDSLLQEKNSTLLGSYSTLTSESAIQIKCSCGTEFTKKFHTIVYKGGGTLCFTCSKASGRKKARASIQEKFSPEHAAQLDSCLKASNSTLLGTYDVLTGDSDIHIKCNCGTEFTKKLEMIIYNGRSALCQSCIKTNCREKTKATNIEKYGCESPMQNKEILDKVKQTCKDKYGGHPLQNAEVMATLKATNIKKYGFANPLQNPEIKQKALDTIVSIYGTTNIMESAEVKSKIRATNLSKYGHEYATQSDVVRSKTEATSLKKYGVTCNLALDSNKEKVKATCLEKYGVENALQSEEVKEKSKKTCILKYGTEYPNQNAEQFEKTQKRAYKLKAYTFPSGNIRMVQGSEPLALDILLQTYTEEQIKTERVDVPRIIYTVDGKEHYYFPDIYLPHENKIIEVKSTWTYACKTDNIHQKETATKALGYEYEIWIFDKKTRVRVI